MVAMGVRRVSRVRGVEGERNHSESDIGESPHHDTRASASDKLAPIARPLLLQRSDPARHLAHAAPVSRQPKRAMRTVVPVIHPNPDEA